MFQQFPIPIAHHPRAPPQPSTSCESQLVQQLRRENEMLKQQLQTLIHSQQQCPRRSPLHLRSNFPRSPNTAVHNREDEAELTYRNKMSKLKNRKSHRKSYEQSATAPCSPKTSTIRYQQPSQLDYQPPQKFPGNKMMVIARDEKGRFFRDRSSQENGSTERKFNPSQERRKIEFSTQNQDNRQNAKINFLKSPGKGHLRVESALPSSIEKTKRNYYEPAPAPTMINILNEPSFGQQHWHRPQPQRQQYANNAVAHQQDSRVPRGNIYIQKVDSAEKAKHQRKETTDWESEGDSRLSIELDLKAVKSKRKLNYDIYLEEENRY